MAQAERDLQTELDWVAVDHWNTDNPHIHVLVRGRDEDGRDLVISRAYISQGLTFLNTPIQKCPEISKDPFYGVG